MAQPFVHWGAEPFMPSQHFQTHNYNAHHPMTMQFQQQPQIQPMYNCYPSFPMTPHFAVPSILPSSSPFVSNPEGAIRDLTEHVTNGDRDQMCDSYRLKYFEDWGKNDEYRKIIVEVLKTRLELAWPYNYKALDILAVMPVSVLPSQLDIMKKLNESKDEGAQELKKVLKPLLEKAEAEKKKQDEEEMKKREAAVLSMWGGLWANDGYKQPMLTGHGWGGFPHPYSAAGIVPGISLPPPGIEWKSNAPEGWQAASITPIPSVYPFSRTGYYGWIPKAEEKKEEEKKAEPGWWVGVHYGPPV